MLPAPPALPWLVGHGAARRAQATAGEQQLLTELGTILTEPVFPEKLLPRAANLIPQLIALLRQTDLPTTEIASRVARDAVLSAEVLRLADSPYYRGQDPVRNLEQAVGRIGEWGLQQVIARVILKPIYQGSRGPWSTRAASRQWLYSEALAQHAAALADASGQPPFDAYLAGMLHGTGWIVVLHLADRDGLALDAAPTEDFCEVLEDRVHRLFGQAAQRWEITPGFTAFARAANRHGPTDGTHALSPVLQDARRLCMDELQAS